MTCPLTLHDVEKIAAVLDGKLAHEDRAWAIEQRSASGTLEQLLTIAPQVTTPSGEITLITVQSRQGFQQLYGCTHWLVIEPDEVLFVARGQQCASCLLVGRQRTCTLYADIPLELLRAPLDGLDPSLLLAVMQLSLAEHLLVVDADGNA
ncbi:MAG: hypothetical protein KatS3mg039_0448 [Candidatus Kapaibacterium sp.]|nr:MAG: hypothetical protein KatS3mg039_0448 [Candidatus Kapabacteria bacterium]